MALSNTTLGMFIASVDASIVLISLPAIFRGIHLDPLAAGNVTYLLWIVMGYTLITAVFVVSLGRLGDLFGRNIQNQFPGAFRIQNRSMMMLVCVVMLVIVLCVCVLLLSRFRSGIVFDGVSRTQRFAFRARQAPNSTATAGCRRGDTASCGWGITSLMV